VPFTCCGDCRSSSDPLQNLCARIARNRLDQNHSSACRFYLFAPDDLVRLPVPTFDQDIRQQRCNHLLRRQILKDHDRIDALEAREDLRALFGRDDRPASPFERAHALVAVQPNDQAITQRPRRLEAVNVPRMEYIEASIGKHNPLAVAFLGPKLQNQLIELKNGRMQSFSMMAQNGRLEKLSKGLFYHAAGLGRFEVRWPS